MSRKCISLAAVTMMHPVAYIYVDAGAAPLAVGAPSFVFLLSSSRLARRASTSLSRRTVCSQRSVVSVASGYVSATSLGCELTSRTDYPATHLASFIRRRRRASAASTLPAPAALRSSTNPSWIAVPTSSGMTILVACPLEPW